MLSFSYRRETNFFAVRRVRPITVRDDSAREKVSGHSPLEGVGSLLGALKKVTSLPRAALVSVASNI